MTGSKDYFLEMQQQGVDIDCNGNMYQELMMNENIPLGAEHSVSPWNEKNEQFLCTECDAPVSTYGMTCSNKCHESSMI